MSIEVSTAADHLVGNLYFNLGALPMMAGILHPDDFPDTAAKTVYREMCRLYLTPDLQLSAGALESALRAVGFDFGFLAQLQTRIMPESVESLKEYADSINRYADKRDAVLRLHGALESLSEEGEVDTVIPELMRTLAVGNRGDKSQGRYIADSMAALRQDIAKWQRGEGEAGLSTGFVDLDRIMRLMPSELVLLAARPSMGKTALAMQIAENVARANMDKTVVIFSAEMSDQSLSLRMASSSAGVNAHRISSQVADPDEYKRILDATERFADVKIWIDDSSSISTEQMYYRTAMMHAQQPVSAVIFDFVELGSDSTQKRGDGEEQRISAIARGLKAIAKNLKIPVLALSQLSRQVESRADKMPVLSDLRYSGMLEQIADVVAFMMRPEYYKKRQQECFMEHEEHADGVCYVTIAKNRNGPVGRVNLSFIERYTRFRNLERVELN
jgi:replicative DNA helicase